MPPANLVTELESHHCTIITTTRREPQALLRRARLANTYRIIARRNGAV